MAQYEIIRTSDRVVLKRTRGAILGRWLQGAFVIGFILVVNHFQSPKDQLTWTSVRPHGLPDALMLAVFLAFAAFVIYKVMIEGWRIEVDRAKDRVSVDGREIGRLQDAGLEVDGMPGVAFFNIQTLALRIPNSRTFLGRFERLVSADKQRRVQLIVTRGRMNALELSAIRDALAAMLPVEARGISVPRR